MCGVLTLIIAGFLWLRARSSGDRRGFETAWRVAMVGALAAIAIVSLWPTRYGYATGLNLVPFKSIAVSFDSSYSMFNLAANVAMGAVVGVTAQRGRFSFLVGVGIAAGFAIVVEVLQGLLDLGISDIDDVILLAAGAAMGYALTLLVMHKAPVGAAG